MLQSGGDATALFNAAEHLTLDGALLVAVVVLWKSNQEKDRQLIETVKTVTSTLHSVNASNQELRKVIEESIRAKDQLREAIEHLRLGIETLAHDGKD